MNVAMCIPTYNRADVVEDTLSRGIEGYTKYGIDLYYYDSSADEKTKNVIQKYIDKGYSNIKYVSVPKAETMKAALIYTEYAFEKRYEYVWPVKDRVWFEEPTLKAVEEAMEEGFDAIFLGVLWCFAHPGIGTKTYCVPQEFYLDWGYLVTSLDVNIFKYNTMLNELTYDIVKKSDISFTHFELMFHNLNKGEKKVRALVGNDIIAYNSQLITSGWKKNAFQTWEDRWIDVNEKLPECYDKYKSTVIKHAGILPWIFGSVDTLIELKNCGALVPDKLDHILKNWDRVSDIPKEKLIAIANGTYDKRHDLDLVPREVDEFLSLLTQMALFIQTGKMNKSQIPYNDVFQGVMNKIMKRHRDNGGIINITAGSVEDLLIYIRDEANSKEEISRAFQQLIAITMAAL